MILILQATKDLWQNQKKEEDKIYHITERQYKKVLRGENTVEKTFNNTYKNVMKSIKQGE